MPEILLKQFSRSVSWSLTGDNRLRGNYYIVDHLFRAAELRIGEKDQTVVRIRKRVQRSGIASLFGGEG